LERDRAEQEEKNQRYLEAKANYDRALETPGYAPQGLSKLKKTLEESKVEKANFGDREKELKREEAELVDPHELELQKQALAFRQLNKTTPKNAKKISFGTRSIEEDFTMTENEDEETAKEFNKIKETVFSEVTAGDETLEFLKTQNEELEISVHNFEALIRQSANYEVQANRLNKIVSELDSFSITDVESLEEEKKTAEQEVEAAKASVKKSKNDPKEVEKLAAAEEKLAKVENKLNKA
jgi:DNA repair exonuclease SbcCD ATPase subunit